MKGKCLSLILRLVAVGICAGLAFAQVNKSNLTGVVQDSSGAVISGASIQLTNLGTGAVRTETTNTTGLYRFTLLDYGAYRLEVSNSGFKKWARGPVQLETGQTTTVDVTLEIGETTETEDEKVIP